MSGIWAKYNTLLEAQPLLTKALTSLTGFTAGDILAQSFVEKSDKPYDVMRTVRLGSFGFFIHGTTGHYFYGMLDSKLPGTKPITVATKVAIDQTIWNPIFGLMFFGYLNAMEGKSFEDYKKKLNADLKTAVMGSWAVWVPAHSTYNVALYCILLSFPCLTPLALFSFQPSTLLLFHLPNACSISTPSRLVTMSFFPSLETSQWTRLPSQSNNTLTLYIYLYGTHISTKSSYYIYLPILVV